MKPLDIVRTKNGIIGIVVETNNRGAQASIDWIKGQGRHGEKNAWWDNGDGIEVIDSLPRLLAAATAHPFGKGKDDVLYFFDEFE